MMKKKVLYLLLTTSMIMALAGCGAKEEASAPVSPEPEVVVEETATEEVVEEEPELTVEELEAMIKEERSKNEPNRDQIKDWCNQAIEMGSGYAMYIMSSECGMDGDYEKSIEFAQKAIDNNNPMGYITLSACYSNGLGVDADINKAIEYANKCIEEGVTYGYAQLGNIYTGTYEGIERDETKMFENYKAYCDLEKEDINYSYYAGLANCYFLGTGVEKDIDKGIEWLIKASEGDELNATVLLANLYYGGNLPSAYEGVEVPVDYDKALSYFEKAEELGHIDSSWILANTYLGGKHIRTGESVCDIDCKKALAHFDKMINSGEDLSSYTKQNLYLYAGKSAYETGDYVHAREFFQKSISLGEPKADTAKSNLEYLDKKGL